MCIGKEIGSILMKAVTTTSLSDSVKEVFLDSKKPVIVIDPGHGYTKGTTGASAKIYTYKTKGDNGKTDAKNVEQLPQYVIEDVSLIVSDKEDHTRSERDLVFDISVKLKKILVDKGYTVLLTRTKTKIEGRDNKETRKARIDFANDNKADYFISIHADGADGYRASGAHTIYPNVDDDDVVTSSKELAEDIFSSYTIVKISDGSPKQDVRGLDVLGKANKTKRITLVELGYITTPKDAKALFTNKDKIAEQLGSGLVKNIKKHF